MTIHTLFEAVAVDTFIQLSGGGDGGRDSKYPNREEEFIGVLLQRKEGFIL